MFNFAKKSIPLYQYKASCRSYLRKVTDERLYEGDFTSRNQSGIITSNLKIITTDFVFDYEIMLTECLFHSVSDETIADNIIFDLPDNIRRPDNSYVLVSELFDSKLLNNLYSDGVYEAIYPLEIAPLRHFVVSAIGDVIDIVCKNEATLIVNKLNLMNLDN